MTRDEAKCILLLYRPGTPEAETAEVVEALALRQHDPELAEWYEALAERQTATRRALNRIAPPPGLKEQILSEQRAKERRRFWQTKAAWAASGALALAVVIWLSIQAAPHAPDNTLAVYEQRMVGIALRGYAMDLTTHDLAAIRRHLASHGAPADFTLPPGLKEVEITGCAVETWQDVKVSMVCFHTSRPKTAEAQSDLWLFVAKRETIHGSPVSGSTTQFAKVNRLATAVWVEGDTLLLLGSPDGEAAVKRFVAGVTAPGRA